MTTKGRWAFLALAIVSVAVVAYVLIRKELALTTIGVGVALQDGALADNQSTAITLTVDLLKLLMNWTFAIMGGVGLFLKLRLETKIRLNAVDLALFFLTVLAAMSSLYFAQIDFDVMVRTLTLQQSPLGLALFTAVRWQFILLLVALLFFGSHLFQYCWRLSREGGNG